MIIILAKVAVYFMVGYLYFRAWLKMSPPAYGAIDWEMYQTNGHKVWHLRMRCVESNDPSERKGVGGLPIEVAFWSTLFLWPFWFVTVAIVAGVYAAERLVSRIESKFLPNLPKGGDSHLIEAQQEVEVMLRHTEECQLVCEHCRCCAKACCWCGAVRDGEGEEQVECTCKPTVTP